MSLPWCSAALGLALVRPAPLMPEDEHAERALWTGLAARCGEELPWAKDWEEAADRARAEKKPVLAVAWLYPGFEIADGAFSDTPVLGPASGTALALLALADLERSE